MEPTYKLTNAETKLAELLWEKGPIGSMELVKLALEQFDWKKSTTFSVLKTLIGKGVAQNQQSVVTMLCTREQLLSARSQQFVEDTFDGSLPRFVAAFFNGKKPTPKQIEELRRLIDQQEGTDG